jgi:folate-binding protein YgfZ
MTEVKNDTEPFLLQWSVIRARGPEAETYLQGQLSQDLTNLADEGAWALVLQPDSAVLATCFVTTSDDGFDLVVPRELADVVATRLKRFLMRTKCTLEVSEVTEGPFVTLEDQIEANWPGVAEFAGSLTPHSFGRHFVATSISFQKGCFTGQELVGRLDARGSSVPWRFVRVSGPSRERIDEVLKSKGPAGPQGLTSAIERAGVVEGLGIAHRTLFAALSDESAVDVTIAEID